MAPLVKEFEKNMDLFDVEVCVTAQHRQMLDQVLSLFEIKPRYDLDIMKKDQDLYHVTSNVLLGMKEILEISSPDLVLVHGDTTTSFATSLAAFYKKIPIGHVEAGLRTWNIYSPWPEELNRQITSQITKYYFAPTETSRANLLREHRSRDNIVVTGNTVIDALFAVLEKIQNDEPLCRRIISDLSGYRFNIADYAEKRRRMVLITGHRRENFGTGFLNICEALKNLSFEFGDVDFIYPVHLNPNVQKPVHELLGEIPNIHLISPLNYEPFIYLMNLSYLILTDSGGVQEEAPSLGKPVLVMRDTTERPEAVTAGTVRIVGTDRARIFFEVSRLLNDKTEYDKMSKAINPYGDGKACRRIVEFLKEAMYADL
ncbi:MAG: UDP-N-acetylglucosamine 2-epimerase (non-hydrolyzing) [Oligoflexales bacterium]|nr:UDP-N-acetylglucosamine 2-epimerase (non-hydrolyzing) [Oligoflexales bacterium]